MPVTAIERPPARETAAAGALVFCHGYRGNEREFLPFLDKLDPARRLHGYLPRAPLRLAEDAFDWLGDDPQPGHFEPYERWLASLPFPPERTILGGWSQGAVAAFCLALGAGRPRPAGLLALGGWYEDGPEEPDVTRPLPPVALYHGRNDDVVPIESVRRTRDVLSAAGADLLYLETDAGHSTDDAVLPDLQAFLLRLP